MPYTFAHIGYSLPFGKKWNRYFSLSGLVFGSIAPDYDILFRLTKNRFHIFQYDLFSIVFYIYPLALLSAIAFHVFCRDVIILHLPEPLRTRFSQYLHYAFGTELRKRFPAITLSVLGAIFLHLYLDFLCHYFDAYSSEVFVYRHTHSQQAAEVGFYAAIYLLPVLFTLVGFYLLWRSLELGSLKFSSIRFSAESLRFWALVFFVTLLTGSLKVWLSHRETGFFIDFLVISMTSAFLIAIYVVCTFYHAGSRLFNSKNH